LTFAARKMGLTLITGPWQSGQQIEHEVLELADLLGLCRDGLLELIDDRVPLCEGVEVDGDPC
jgi:hypothetical protein